MKKIFLFIVLAGLLSCNSEPKYISGTISSKYTMSSFFGNSLSYYFVIDGRDENNKQVRTSVEVSDTVFNSLDYDNVYTKGTLPEKNDREDKIN